MKRKNQNSFLCSILFTAALLASCDMTVVNRHDAVSDGVEITEKERDDYEKTGRYLKLVNMPVNTQISNVFSASVSNSTAAVGKLDKNKKILIYREKDSCSAYLPLVCNDGTDFLETGFFYTAFSVHVDALTKYVVESSDMFVVSYTDGRGQADVNSLFSSAAVKDFPCLTIYNLPSSVSVYNFSSVFVHNQTGVIAECLDCSQIVLFAADNRASAKIPLHYRSLKQPFFETGVYYVSFDVNVDVDTRYTVAPDDNVKVTFVNGNGYVDILNIPDKPVPYLVVKGLPVNSAKHHISKIAVYNASGVIAECRDYKLVSVLKSRDSSSFLIPLYYSDGSFFQDSGKFWVSFEINVDIDTQIIFTRADNLSLSFTNGSAEFDVSQYVSSSNPTLPENPDNITEKEREELEKNGRFLKLVNMPPNVQSSNVFSVSVANSSSTIARLDAVLPVSIFRETDNTAAVYMPLVYLNNLEFLETGNFYVAFNIHVDAVTKYVVEISDRFIVPFVNGQGRVDVDGLPSLSSPPNNLTLIERDQLEATGHYLKLLNMPVNTQAQNVISVSVENSFSKVGKLDSSAPVMFYRGTSTCSVYLPLVYIDNSDFFETGSYYVAFNIHVDALTKYVVEISDHFIVTFTSGRGQADVNSLPSTAVTASPCLTVSNLPSSVSTYSFSNVFVRDQAGVVAKCGDYSQIILSVTGVKKTAKIPLLHNSSNQIFTETGSYYVLFNINVDAVTKYVLDASDRFIVPFVNGDGFLDIGDLPPPPGQVDETSDPPLLTIKGLPSNATARQISNVNVYNLAGSVASCANYNDVVVVKENDLSTFLVPLSSAHGGFFLDSGRFAISFTVNVDFETQISYSKNDNVVLYFSDGCAEFDIASYFGHFDVVLDDMDGSESPVIKAGSSFDVNGNRCVITNDLEVSALLPNYSCVLFLYAYRLDSQVFYEFSATAPSYNASRVGWYDGPKRALLKMVYLYNTVVPQFLFKTFAHNNFPQFGKYTFDYSTSASSASSNADFSQITSSIPVSTYIDGSNNPPPQTVTLEPGVYVVELKGAGGGMGGNGANGGYGGSVREILTLNSSTSFTAFTGAAGGNGAVDTFTGLDINSTRNYYTYSSSTSSSQSGWTIILSDLVYHATNTFTKIVNINEDNAASGGGGGGGGSASFLYSPTGYLLTATGGGGAAGLSSLSPGGGGGAGGVIGPGAAGGRSGSLSEINLLSNTSFLIVRSMSGGNGGGYLGGSSLTTGAGDGYAIISESYVWTSGGGGAPASAFISDFYNNVNSKIPYLTHPVMGTYTGLTTNNSLSNFSPTIVTSSYKAVSLCTDFSATDASPGGKTPGISHPAGPYSWLDTGSPGSENYDIKGKGGDASSAEPFTLSGSPSLPNNWSSNSSFPSSSCLNLTVNRSGGYSGTVGGNNRNSNRGGGAASGEAGSINIYKIY